MKAICRNQGVTTVVSKLPAIPTEYLEFIQAHGTFEGFTSDQGEPGYVELWAPEAIPRINKEIEVETLAPGFLAFAGNGGGEVLAFDVAGAVYMLPMIGMEPGCAIQIASDFLIGPPTLARRFVR
jgi:hypothetical protein